MKLKLSTRLSNLDIYGEPVGVNFKGKARFKTWLGGICSLVTWILLLYNFTTLLIAYNSGSRRDEKFSIAYYDRFDSEKFYLAENGIEI